MFDYKTTFNSRGGESKPSLWPRGPPVWDVRQASFCRHYHVNHRTTIINITFIISNIIIIIIITAFPSSSFSSLSILLSALLSSSSSTFREGVKIIFALV